MSEAHRYLFLVRQPFGDVPGIDSFYKVGVPEGVTKEQALIMEKLTDGDIFKILKEDPPVRKSDGTLVWRDKDGQIHRDGGLPAIDHIDGTKVYYKHGKNYKI